jgi:leucyl/phenylalanyl-tRNA--protein transferase
MTIRLRASSEPLLVPDLADDQGLVAVGGDLTPDRLLQAYRNGVFPWYDEQTPICWWSPDPRAIFELDSFHISRRLRRTIHSGRFSVTLNRGFSSVIRGCAHRPAEGTWITPDMIAAYETLHQLGHAHSVEVWADGALAGGVYGLALAGLFAGESMFSRRPDASKVALAFLVDHLLKRRFQLFDIQFLTAHTASLGAVEIPRSQYLARLRRALKTRTLFD